MTPSEEEADPEKVAPGSPTQRPSFVSAHLTTRWRTITSRRAGGRR
jgi:hypothetical protein